MQFNSLGFALFFAFVLVVHRLPLAWSLRKFNLLWLSYVFYAAWSPPFVILLWVSTIADWYLGRWLHASRAPGRRRLFLGLSLLVNLGMLSYFKYGEFLTANTAALLQAAGIDWQPLPWDVALPIGISFYTFQTLSYTLDIYWRRIKPWTSFLDYALFVTFFPQLVAGPIVRAREFLPQCRAPQVVTGAQFGWGLTLFAIGLFQKVFLADALLAPVVEAVYAQAGVPTRFDAWVGSISFGAQIYCDFAGYSLCAIGIALCLGFQLPTNFRFPLAAAGFQDFWSRWYISLSTWLRDYVFVSARMATAGASPLVSWSFSILTTWTLIGLWHGGSWTFVFWGFLCGVYMLLERFARALAPPSPLWRAAPVQFGFALIQFTMLTLSIPAFRAGTVDHMVNVYAGMAGGAGPSVLHPADVGLALTTAGALFLGHWILRDSSLEAVAQRMPWPLKAIVLGAIVFAVIMSRGGDRAFLYFQF